MLKVGDKVVKTKGDYVFDGVVISVMNKINFETGEPSGQVRLAVQNAAGMIHIFNEKQLSLKGDV